MDYTFSNIIERFPTKWGWYFVRLPDDFNLRPGISKTRYGFIPIMVYINDTHWKTSLLPMGDKSFFIALKSDIRKKLKLKIWQALSISFVYKGE